MRRSTCAFVIGGLVLVLAGCQSGGSDDAGQPADSIEPASDDPATSSAPVSAQLATTPPTGPTTSAPSPASTGSSASTGSTPPAGSAESVFEAGDIDHGLDPYIRRATDDLAARLSIDTSEITTVSAVLVVWPDGGLGCNDPLKSYAQVTADGSVIELEAGGRFYRYHSGGPEKPFLCERPLRSTPTRL
jgi:hypothetical protein